MKRTVIRVVVSIIVGAIVFFLGGPIIRWTGYDMFLQAIFYLAGIIAAGCYWIGSAKND